MAIRLALLLAALLAAPPAWAQGIEPEPFRLGLVGLARLQAARLNLVNHPPDPGQPPPGDICPVAVGFVNAAGNPFLSAAGAPIAAQFNLAPGASASLDLPAADAFRGVTGLRVAVRGTLVTAPPDDQAPDPCARVVPTFEIFDQLSGRTTLALYPFQTPPDDIAPAPTGP